MAEYALLSMVLVLFLLIFIKVPIGFALGFSSLLYIWMKDVPLTILAQYLNTYLDSFTLLAIPLFILSGEFMNRGGVTHRLISFANSLVGHIPGGLAHVNVGTSILMAGMSGSSSSDAATTSLVLVPQMEREGYSRAFAAAITAASATIGPVIPPSIHVVLMGGINEISIGRLFMGGVVPGLLMGVSMMLYTIMISKKRHFPRNPRVSFTEFVTSLTRAFWPLLTPVIILGGMMVGIFTPTEAAAIAALYTLFLGTVLYRKIGWKDLLPACLNTVKVTSNIMLIVGFAGVFGWILISEEVALTFTQWIQSFTDNWVVVLIIVNVLLLFLGCFLSTTSLIVILSPILFPMIEKFGIDPVHFGIMMMLNLEIGQLTPPVGITSFVVMDVAKTDIKSFMREMIPFLYVLGVVLLLTTYVPQVVTFLPNLIFGASGN
ncbi:TRAP transporter large permease [Desulfoferula mesophila]|uniref:ABC transporter permease n=1 Tax=Desulfoferula mesophila TaxID=3058419 RepID=A0AAU9EF50_9BACT|nr:ABC transporter permease [Desulfoferula mesophilus]